MKLGWRRANTGASRGPRVAVAEGVTRRRASTSSAHASHLDLYDLLPQTPLPQIPRSNNLKDGSKQGRTWAALQRIGADLLGAAERCTEVRRPTCEAQGAVPSGMPHMSY